MNDADRGLRRPGTAIVAVLLCLTACQRTTAPLPENRGAPFYPAAPPDHLRGLTVTPGALVVAAVADDQVVAYADNQRLAWRVLLPRGEQLVYEPRVALDSITYLLTSRRLRAIQPDGRERLNRALPATRASPPHWSLAIHPDSTVTLSDGARTVVRLRSSGDDAWRFTLPAGATLVAEPVAGPNGSLYLRTAAWIFAVSGEGALRWQVPARALP